MFSTCKKHSRIREDTKNKQTKKSIPSRTLLEWKKVFNELFRTQRPGLPRTCRPWNYLLQKQDDPHEHLRAELFQREERAGRPDEDFGLPVSHVVLKAALLDQLPDGLFVRREVVVGPGEFRDHLVPGRKTAGRDEGRTTMWSRGMQKNTIP